jgi:hypothetical protein
MLYCKAGVRAIPRDCNRVFGEIKIRSLRVHPDFPDFIGIFESGGEAI